MPTLLISDLGHFQVPGTQPSYDGGPAGRGGYVPRCVRLARQLQRPRRQRRRLWGSQRPRVRQDRRQKERDRGDDCHDEQDEDGGEAEKVCGRGEEGADEGAESRAGGAYDRGAGGGGKRAATKPGTEFTKCLSGPKQDFSTCDNYSLI
jgi:hypothetical protein